MYRSDNASGHRKDKLLDWTRVSSTLYDDALRHIPTARKPEVLQECGSSQTTME